MDIIIKDQKDDILDKDCVDFVPMDDGTIIGEKKYCNLSFQCKQIGYYSEYCEFFDENGNVVLRDYLCTGKKMRIEEINKDEEAN
jgi:hypothetical protein